MADSRYRALNRAGLPCDRKAVSVFSCSASVDLEVAVPSLSKAPRSGTKFGTAATMMPEDHDRSRGIRRLKFRAPPFRRITDSDVAKARDEPCPLPVAALLIYLRLFTPVERRARLA